MDVVRTQLGQLRGAADPLDLSARIVTREADTELEWVRTRGGRWKPVGVASGGYSWASMVYLFPDAELVVPEVSTGRTIPARRTDPGTSKQATDSIKDRAGSQRARLLAAFARNATDHVVDGLTDEQAARVAEDVSLSSEYAKRCSELREAGLIEPTGETRPGASGAARIVSRITPAGSKVLTGINT
jgi:hypothetical protein